MKTTILLVVLCVFLAGPALAEEQHQHRCPDDIQQYLEYLDSTERDRYQKSSEVIEALKVKPGMAVADLASGSGYFTRRFVETVTEAGKVYAVDVEPEKYFSNLKSSLKPGARIAIIDFYPDERSGDLGFPKHHLVPRDTFIAEMATAGYQLAREHSFLPKQYFVEFRPKVVSRLLNESHLNSHSLNQPTQNLPLPSRAQQYGPIR